ncbi:MAG: beta-lactamase [Chloroflexi bacterium OLB14]|nr:MAG: beta-lactamase [Chloroflexi bacterium OLB14]
MTQIENFISQFPDKTISVSVYDLETNQEININADVLMHPASVMKVPVMMEVFRLAQAGTLSLDDEIELYNSFHSIVDNSQYQLNIDDDSDKTLYTKIGEKETIRELNRLMIIRSSNLATNVLMDKVGTKAINDFIQALGIKDMTVLRLIEDKLAYGLGINNAFSARATTYMMRLIAEGKVVSKQASDEMIQVMLGQEFNESIPALLPKDVKVAHKTGWNEDLFHDSGIVFPPNRKPYAITLFTDGFPENDNSQAHKCMAEVSKLVYESIIK